MNSSESLRGLKTRLIFIVLLSLILLIWISIGKIDVVIHASGKIIPSQFVKIVQNLEGGVITSINIRAGQQVQRGQILVQLSAIGHSGELDSIKKRLGALQARKSRLKAEVDGLEPKFSEDLISTFPDLISSELREFDLRRRKQDQLQKLVNFAIEEYDLIRRLRAEGLEPASELIRVERTLTEKQQQLNDFREVVAAEYGRVSNEHRSLEDSVISLKDKVNRSAITAPVDGVAGRVFVTTMGGVVKPGESILEIVPLDDKLVIEARLFPEDVAFVYPNMPAVIKITAYDSSVFGSFKGNVDFISPDVVTNDQGETYYQMRVLSDGKKIDNNGNMLTLMPGMMAQVDLVTKRRTFLQYILKPFESLVDNSFKER